MIGQYTEQEFFVKYDRADDGRLKMSEGLAWIRFGSTRLCTQFLTVATNHEGKEELTT